MEHALQDLVGRRPVKEAAIVSTCNRTEVYCSTDKPEEATRWLADFHQLKARDLDPYLYKLPREQAVKHAFRVASGLDSMVLGEPQILGPVQGCGEISRTCRHARNAAEQAVSAHLFCRQGGAHSTEIGTNSVSMAAAAIRLAERIFGDIDEQTSCSSARAK